MEGNLTAVGNTVRADDGELTTKESMEVASKLALSWKQTVSEESRGETAEPTS